MIKCANLQMKYGRKEVLKNISLSFAEGKITVILGKNGSGKTSLLRCLSLNSSKFKGEVILEGKDIKDYKDKQRAQIISMMPQILPRPAISVENLVKLGRYPYSDDLGRISDEDNLKVEESLVACGIERLRDNLVCHLSGGERQLAYFAMLCCQDSGILLMDEPSSALDVIYRKQLQNYLQLMKNNGKTIILSMHDINEAIDLADDIIVIDEGKIIYQGNKEDFVESDIVKDIFGLKKVFYRENDAEKIFFK